MKETIQIRKEYELILLVVLVKKTLNEINRVDKLLKEKIDWVEVGGILLNHRLGGYFINGLNEKQLRKIPRELRKNLQMLVLGQKENQQSLVACIQELSNKLENEEIRYAGLKGIIFDTEIYSKGTRRSNDLDILVYEEDLGKLDNLMRRLGYIQSLRPNGKLIEATKKEKMIQRLNYHDLVPYVKEGINGIVEVDINFLFDGKNNIIEKKVFELGTMIYKGEEYSFRGLTYITNLAFLISHFYREATEELWVNNHRNLVLYKIIDIVNYIRTYNDKVNVLELIHILNILNLIEKGLFVFYIIQEFFNNELVKKYVDKLEEQYPEYAQKLNCDKQIFKQFFEDSFLLNRN